MTAEVTRFLGFDFAHGSRETLFRAVTALAHGDYRYVVTPNVDFVNRASVDEEARALYAAAALRVCDSRVLALAARARGVTLSCYPGSDLVPDLLSVPGSDLSIATVGPTKDDLETLRRRYPEARLSLIATPQRMTPGDRAWTAGVAAAAATRWDVLLVCLGSPKQERFARDLARAGRETGVALCVGASVDFLTGKQRRAPRWMQRAHLEWLHRLASNPRRLGRRYLVDGPRLIRLLLRNAP